MPDAGDGHPSIWVGWEGGRTRGGGRVGLYQAVPLSAPWVLAIRRNGCTARARECGQREASGSLFRRVARRLV